MTLRHWFVGGTPIRRSREERRQFVVHCAPSREPRMWSERHSPWTSEMLPRRIIQSVARTTAILLSSKNVCVVFFFSLLTYAILYRAVLYFQLYHLSLDESRSEE